MKIKIVRELNGGSDQFIDQLDVSDPEYGIAADIDFSSKSVTWSGIPHEIFGSSAESAQGADEFEGVSVSVKRILPAVTKGQPVPPPLYTAVASIYRMSDSSVFCEARKSVFVPQVIKMMYDLDAVAIIKDGMTDENNVIWVESMNDYEWNTQKNRIRDIAQYYYDVVQVNIRIVNDSDIPVPVLPYSTFTMNTEFGAVGSAEADFPNASPSNSGVLRPNGFISAFLSYLDQNPTFQLPVTKQEIGNYWAETTVHECGHMLGLVCPGDVLDGSPVGYAGDSCGWHNKMPYTALAIMNPGSVETISDTIGRNGNFIWKSRNHNYLRFVLPKE